MISKKEIFKLANERIHEIGNGNYLVDINITSKNSIIVEMDNLHGGVSINDCVSVSRNIEHNLDREVEDFDLKVTSPGLDKPFKVEQQYLKNIGKKVSLIALDNATIDGELIEFKNNRVKIRELNIIKNQKTRKKETIEKIHVFSLEEIKEVKLIISF